MVRASHRRTLFLMLLFFLFLHILVLPGELIRLRQGKRRQRDRGVMGMCIEINIVTFSEGKKTKGVFGLRNHSVQNEVVHYGSIPQNWWDDPIPYIRTK
jgi:hypothetical protein